VIIVSVMTINAQPVENRRQKSARRGKGNPPQHGSQEAEDGSQSTFHMIPSGKVREQPAE